VPAGVLCGMSGWEFVYDRYRPGQERLREALCTTGNGYFATRGAAPEERAGTHHYPGTYVAGCYNRLGTDIAGKTVVNESLVNVPNWLPLAFAIGDDDWLSLDDVEILDYRQALDLARGVLCRDVTFADQRGRETRIAQWRFVHMDRMHAAALHTRFVPLNWSGGIRVCSALDGRVRNDGVERYSELASRHLQTRDVRVVDRRTIALTARTNDSGLVISEAASTRLYRDEQVWDPIPDIDERRDYIAQIFHLDLERHEPLVVEKLVALYTSRDSAIYRPDREACKDAVAMPRADVLCREHEVIWDHLWRRFSFEITHDDSEEGDRTERILRLHVFHLLQTCSPIAMDLDVSVPARGLHGEAYRGHIFWDELFIFPLLNLRIPNITRALLEYRFRRLDEARRAALEAGYRGAMYPWQSGSNGREESQRLHLNPQSGRWIPDNSRRQRHVNAAIAYNIWQYYQVTEDIDFLAFIGAEMILEIARFWSSIAEFDEAHGRYEIRGVMGPDEYHEDYPGSEGCGLNNNAYTNVMAVWVLRTALALEEALGRQRWDELCRLLDLDDEERSRWEDITRRMFVPFHGDGIISQFEGYEDLEEFDWEGYRERYDDIQRLDRILEAEDDTPNRYKASKQADVLMLFYLLSADELRELFDGMGYRLEADAIPRNIEYYLARTSHGSTLSRVVHSWVLARANREGAWDLFCDALRSDVADIQGGTTSEGIHTGAMAGSVDLVQRCFTGIETRRDTLRLDPCLPDPLERLELQIRYRQHTLDLTITRDSLSVRSEAGPERPICLHVNGEDLDFPTGASREFPLQRDCGPRDADDG